MSDEEDYSSADDEDYVPSDKEGLSEEDESGEEEDLAVLNDGDSSANKSATGRGKRKKKKNAELMPRKRRGGIKLDGEEAAEANVEEDVENNKLKEEIVKEQEVCKQEKEKKKADDLWASFLSDVGQKPKPKPTPTPSGAGLGSLTATCIQSKPKSATPTSSNGDEVKPTATVSQKITVTKVFDFAGEEVKIKEEVDIKSKEGQKALKDLEEEKSGSEKEESVQQNKPAAERILGQTGPQKPAKGLGSVLGKIGKKNKLSALTKSKLDWDSYKKEEGIEEDLRIHNRGKEGYIERMAFLQRADVRQFEIEKNLRQSTSKR